MFRPPSRVNRIGIDVFVNFREICEKISSKSRKPNDQRDGSDECGGGSRSQRKSHAAVEKMRFRRCEIIGCIPDDTVGFAGKIGRARLLLGFRDIPTQDQIGFFKIFSGGIFHVVDFLLASFHHGVTSKKLVMTVGWSLLPCFMQ